MKLDFSREDSAWKTYQEFKKQGYRVEEPYRDQSLWVLEYMNWDWHLTSKVKLARANSYRRRKYAKTK